MPRYILSTLAESDLGEIIDYTLDNWGEAQADAYLDGLYALFDRLEQMPELGRSDGASRPGLRRFEHGKHVIFYRPWEEGIRITRVLHQSMLPGEHHVEDLWPLEK